MIPSHVLPKEEISLALETNRLFQAAEFGYELAIKGNLIRMTAMCIAGAERHGSAKSGAETDIVKTSCLCAL